MTNRKDESQDLGGGAGDSDRKPDDDDYQAVRAYDGNDHSQDHDLGQSSYGGYGRDYARNYGRNAYDHGDRPSGAGDDIGRGDEDDRGHQRPER